MPAYPAVQAFGPAGYQNIYIPGYMGDAESQRRLIVGFTLNEEDYALNNYVTVFGADKPKGFYLRYYSPDMVRVPFGDGKDLRWADGADRPRAGENPRFVNEQFELFRYGDMTFLGDQAEEFSDIGPLIPTIQTAFASQFMVRRTIAAHTALTDSTAYPPGGTVHYYSKYGVLANAAVTLGYNAGYFGVAGTNTVFDGTINDPLLGKMLKHGVVTILKRSNGRVKPQDLMLLMNPNTASRLANTQEIRAYLAQQSNSIDVLQGKGATPLWPTFGLPNPLYGLKVLVDPTTKVTTKQAHTAEDTQTFVIQDGLMSIVARPGGVSGMPGSTGFGSLALWQHKKQAMKPETFPDVENRRVKIAFSDMFVVKLVAPEITFTVADAGAAATS